MSCRRQRVPQLRLLPVLMGGADGLEDGLKIQHLADETLGETFGLVFLGEGWAKARKEGSRQALKVDPLT